MTIQLNSKRGSVSDSRLEFTESGSTAELVVYGRIGATWYEDGVNANKVAKDLLASKATTINVRINSGGGSAFDGVAIYNALKRHPARIVVTIDGQAGSAASVIAMAADELIMPRGSFLWIHNAWTYAGGEAKELRKVADQLDQLNDEIARIYSEKSGLSHDVVVAQMSDETWFSPADAKEKGYADKIDESSEVEAYAHGDVAFFAGVPMSREFVPDEIFKNLRPAAAPKPAAPAKAEEQKPMNLETLKATHPELYASIVADASKTAAESARAEGAKAERERIETIEAAAVPGYEELVAKAKADPSMNGKDLAWEIAKQIKASGKGYLSKRAADASELDAATPEPNASAHVPGVDAQAAKRNALIQAMAADFDAFASVAGEEE